MKWDTHIYLLLRNMNIFIIELKLKGPQQYDYYFFLSISRRCISFLFFLSFSDFKGRVSTL